MTPFAPKRSAIMSTRHFPLTFLLALTVMAAGCNLFNNSDAPDTAAITTDTFNGPLAQNSSIVFGFKVTTAGTVSVTLTSVTPATSATLGLGVGTSSNGTTCSLTNSTSAAVAGSAAQLTTTLGPGPYCVKVYDEGHLTAASSVALSVAHP